MENQRNIAIKNVVIWQLQLIFISADISKNKATKIINISDRIDIYF